MSGTLHGQSWANLLGLGLLAPKAQLLSHINMEVKINCAYDKTGRCFLGQQTLSQAPSEAGWALDGSPSMNFDNGDTFPHHHCHRHTTTSLSCSHTAMTLHETRSESSTPFGSPHLPRVWLSQRWGARHGGAGPLGCSGQRDLGGRVLLG